MTISQVAVVGAGTMGIGIAQHIASEGVPVLLLDRRREVAADGKTRVEMSLVDGLERGLFDGPDVDAILARIDTSGDLGAAAAAGLVIEAVEEVLESKRQVMVDLSRVCPPATIFATSTGAFQVGQVAEGAERLERVVGLHFLYHPAKNHLIEVVAHAFTDPDVVREAWAFQDRIRKTGIASADRPGFIVARMAGAWLNEAVRIHEEGVAAVDIDAAACAAFGVRTGPFALMNTTGVQMAAAAQAALGEALGDLYRPADLLIEQATHNRVWRMRGKANPSAAGAIADRLWGVAMIVAGELLTEGVGGPADIDIGARLGLGWNAGPVETMNILGLDRTRELTAQVQRRYGLPQPRALAEGAATGGIAIERVRVNLDDGVATLTINRPDKGNPLDFETLNQLGEHFAGVCARADVRAVVIAGAGPAFSVGADLDELAGALRSDRGAEPLLDYARRGREVLHAIEGATVPVICRLDGTAVGAGAELALACHTVVATPRACLSFPETSWGIQPMLSGTQRLTRRLGRGLARYLLFTGMAVKARDLEALNLVWRVVSADEMPATVARAIDEAPRHQRCIADRAPAGLSDAGRFLGAVPADGLIDGTLTLPGGTEILEVARQVRRKAPEAVRAVASLTELAATGDVGAGLAAETAGLRALLETRDAVEGLTAAAENREPVFRGV